MAIYENSFPYSDNIIGVEFNLHYKIETFNGGYSVNSLSLTSLTKGAQVTVQSISITTNYSSITVGSPTDTIGFKINSNNNIIKDLNTVTFEPTNSATLQFSENTNATVNIHVTYSQYGKTSGFTTSQAITIPAVQFFIAYHANGGSNAPGTTYVNYGATTTISNNTPTRTGYTCIGWGVAPTDTTVTYYPGSSITLFYNINLYAIWVADTYTVSYNPCGGSVSPSSIWVQYDSTYGNLAIPSKTGYIFNGWYTSATGGTKITSTSEVTTAKDHTLYAQWTAKKLQVYFYKNATENETPYTETYTYGANNQYFGMNLKTNTGDFGEWFQSGYTLRGWTTTKLTTNMEYAKTDYDIKAEVENSLINSLCGNSATGTLTLYAVWYEHYLMINFHSNGADSVVLNETLGSLLNNPILHKDVVLVKDKIMYNTNYPNGIYNYCEDNAEILMTRSGFVYKNIESKIGWWCTTPNNTGKTLWQNSSGNGKQLAELLGTSIADENAVIDLYPMWKSTKFIIQDGQPKECIIRIKQNNNWIDISFK